jgi:prephenate dehydratase
MLLAYLGPEGTFTEEALRASAGGWLRDGEPVPMTTVHDAVMAVQEGAADRAIVPIENALEGSVSATLDALVHDAPSVAIVGEFVLPVRHCVIAREPIALGAVSVVLSHPHALAQCARRLRAELPAAAQRAATSTAEAVREVAGSDQPWAAIGPRLAAERYGAAILAEGFEDEPDNATRFVWLARGEPGQAAGAPHPATPPLDPTAPHPATPPLDPTTPHPATPPLDPAGWKTSIVFAGGGDAAPGWLVRCLSEFAFRGVNLTKIESRPARRSLGHYVFLLDCEGRADRDPVSDAIAGLHAHCDQVRVLGTYPAARPAAGTGSAATLSRG